VREYENGFGALLDELENLHDKRGNPLGPLRKSTTPARPAPVRIAKVTRSQPVAFSGLETRHRRDYGSDLDDMISGMNKAMSNTRAATIRMRKPRGADLRKAMTDFNANLRKAVAAGELTPDQVCRLEAYRNRMLQRPITGLI